MTSQELEQLIEGQSETPNLDFKQDCHWDVRKMAKDLIAMSNLRDGGHIVVGVREEPTGFVAEGVCDENLNSYNVDRIRDDMFKYADPPIDLRVFYPTDSEGHKYVVLKVLSFREVPVLSKRDDGDLKAHTLYYRNSNRRVESAPISNSHDLRDIIELAAVRLMQRRKSYGYIVESHDNQILDEEFNSLPPSKLLEKIKSRGYWEIKVRPHSLGKIETLRECLKVVEKSQVVLNWTFPRIPVIDNETESKNSSNRSYQSESNLGSRKEFWSMYQSEQFIMYSALVEDWVEEDPLRKSLSDKISPGKVLMLYTSVVHLITQCLEFLSRLNERGLYKNGVTLFVTLYGARGRTLYLDDPSRFPFLEPKKTNASRIELIEDLSPDQIKNDSVSISNKFILKVLDHFDFHPTSAVILRDQEAFLSGI